MVINYYQYLTSIVNNSIEYAEKLCTSTQEYVQQRSSLQKISTIILCLTILSCAVFIIWGSTELYSGGTTGTPVDITVKNHADAKITPIGKNRYRIEINNFHSPTQIQLNTKNSSHPQQIMLRLGQDRIYQKPTIKNVGIEINGNKHEIDSDQHRTYIPISDSNILSINLHANNSIDSPKKLIISEVSLVDKISHNYIKTYRKIEKKSYFFLGLVVFCILISCSSKRSWLAFITISLLFGAYQLLALLMKFNPETYEDLRVYYSSGILQEGLLSNLRYGLSMADSLLQGDGLLVYGIPPWHRMPGYGLLLALTSNASSLITSALNGVLLQIFLTSATVGLFYICCKKITAHWVTLLLICFFIAMPYFFYYHQIESIMPAIVFINLSAACLYIQHHYKSSTVPFRYHLFLHGSFALWLLMRPDVLPGWIIVSLLMYARKLKTIKNLLIPFSLILIICMSWGLYKYQFTGEFSPTTNSSGASLMVGLWEIPNKFVWTINDGSFIKWINDFVVISESDTLYLKAFSHTSSSLAKKEVFRFWFTYPFYMVSLVWHKFMVYLSISPIPSAVYQYALFFIMLIVLACVTAYKRMQVLLLGWTIPFNITIFFLVFSSSGRFYLAPNLALLTISLILLFDKDFIKCILEHPKRCISIMAIFFAVGLWGQQLDQTMIASPNFRYYAPFLDPTQSSLNIINTKQPIDPKITTPKQISLEKFKSASKESQVTLTQDLHPIISTGPAALSYAAIIPLPNDITHLDKMLINVNLSVLKGQAMVGVLSSDQSVFLANSENIAKLLFQAERDYTVSLKIDNPSNAGFILVQNGQTGWRSTVRINKIEYGNYEEPHND